MPLALKDFLQGLDSQGRIIGGLDDPDNDRGHRALPAANTTWEFLRYQDEREKKTASRTEQVVTSSLARSRQKTRRMTECQRVSTHNVETHERSGMRRFTASSYRAKTSHSGQATKLRRRSPRKESRLTTLTSKHCETEIGITNNVSRIMRTRI